jgi:hypothetical protein
MNSSIFAPRAAVGDLARVVPRVHVHRPRASLQAFRAWMNEPARHEPTPIAGYMSGLLLRPADRPDINRHGQR